MKELISRCRANDDLLSQSYIYLTSQEEKQEVRKGPMTKEEWERLEKIRRSIVLPDPDCKRQHYDANKRKEAAEYSWVLSGSPPPPHVRAAYKTFKKPQGF